MSMVKVDGSAIVLKAGVLVTGTTASMTARTDVGEYVALFAR